MRSYSLPRAPQVRAEIPPLWRLAWPVVLGEVGWQAMGLVDTLVVGRVSAAALAGVGVGSALFFVVAVFGIGMLLGLDFAVARAVGGGNRRETANYLWHGLALALGLGIVLTAVLRAGIPLVRHIGLEDEVAAIAIEYLRVLHWSLLPLLVFTALRRFLQALGAVRVVAVAVLLANVVNAVVDWMLVLGNWGAPAMGATGAAWATLASRLVMLAILAGYLVAAHGDTLRERPRWRWQAIATLMGLGFPAAMQLTLEVGVFALVTALAGRFGATALAAHHVVLNIASLSFMVPLGISAAAAVRVGHAVGRRDGVHAATAGWTAIGASAAVMCGWGLVFVAVPESLMRIFTPDLEVIAFGATLLLVAAAFQLFDGVQVVATGALRGTGDTRMAMLTNLVAHWCVGLPVGSVLAFSFGWGITGLWIGLCVGLVGAAFALLAFWGRRLPVLAGELSGPGGESVAVDRADVALP